MSRVIREFRRRWLMPPGVHDALTCFTTGFRSVFSPSRRSRLARVRRNRELRNRFRGRRAFVIGNGPSLARQDLAPLAGEVTIVMNAFYRHPILQTGWRPTVHCMAEPAKAYDNPLLLELLRDCTSVSADIHLFPLEVRTILESQQLLPPEKVRYADFWLDTSMYSPARLPNLAGPLPHMANTAHLAIVVAMYLGCSPIYLLGLDHDWLANRGIDRHFYAHQGPETVPGGLWDLRRYAYLQVMESTARVWREYIWLDRIARSYGIEIFNASDGGFLDVFPRASYEEVAAVRRAA